MIKVPRNIDKLISKKANQRNAEANALQFRNMHEVIDTKPYDRVLNEIPLDANIRFKAYYNENNSTVSNKKCVHDSGLVSKEIIVNTINDILDEKKHHVLGTHVQKPITNGQIAHFIGISCHPRLITESTINMVINYNNTIGVNYQK